MEFGSQLRSGAQQPSSAVHELDSFKHRHWFQDQIHKPQIELQL